MKDLLEKKAPSRQNAAKVLRIPFKKNALFKGTTKLVDNSESGA